ncbi:MAG: CHAT domain-containing protein, partial [Pyrinomonadaceae bacterium]|nr:CHAT domain-containing protein [Pyrinomonadaceae bacterium]
PGEGRALGNLGKASEDSSKSEQAIDYYQQALTIFREAKDREMEGVTLNNIGTSYNSLSQYERAIQYLEQALTFSRDAKDQLNEARVLTNLGTSYYLLSQFEKAASYYQQGLDLRRRIKDRRGEGLTLGNLAKTYNRRGEYQQAGAYLEQALAIKREIKDRAGEGYTLNDLGTVYISLGQYEKAIQHFEQALLISREVKDRIVEADSLSSLGFAHYSLTRYEKALEYYQHALAINREIKHRAAEGRTLKNLMLVWERQHNNPVAILYGKQAVNAFQEIRSNIKTLSAESRQSYLKSNEDVYRKLADLLISEGRLAEAEKLLELLKDEEFNRILRRNSPLEPDIGLTTTEAEASKITDQLAELASERGPLLAKMASQTATDQDRQRLDLIDAKITAANRKIKLVLAKIARTTSEGNLVTQQSQSMMQSLRKLGHGTVAVYTVLTDAKGWVILTTSDFRRAYPISTADLNKNLSDFRLTLKTGQYDPVLLAQKLYSALFLQRNEAGATLAADLRAYKAKTLMWSLDGVLRYLPIAALHDGKSYLVANYSFLVFTTASLTRLLDSAEGNWRALGLGVSKQYREFPALTFVPSELRSIIREEGVADSGGVLPGVIRLDEQFTRKAMLDGLREGYAVVHIASHFRFIPEREEMSYLLLGDGSTLSVQELQNAPGILETVELLTLSACETALGANGRDVEGLAFVAQDLGAKAVVASLWPVADEGTEVLMREFYRLKQANPQWSKAEALRHAQLALLRSITTNKQTSENVLLEESQIVKTNQTGAPMKRFKKDPRAPFAHPHYWAPFILIGNGK